MLYYRGSTIQASNLEWQYPAFWEPSAYSLVLFGSLIVLLLRRRETRPADWLLFVIFTAASLLCALSLLAGPLRSPTQAATTAEGAVVPGDPKRLTIRRG